MKPIQFVCLILVELSLNLNLAYGQQSLDVYISDSAKNNFVIIAQSSHSVSTPIDLDFFPDQQKRPNELWILNQGSYNSGGSTVIISNAHQNNRTYQYVKDGNAWHFMAMASAIAFGDSNFATSADILDANRSSGKYTGPTLWSGNLSVYGVIGNPPSSQYNGSHLDMIHQSPYGKGIAFEKENIYWVLDGYSGTLKRYDFNADHGPGQEYHGDGEVRVYTDFSFTRHLSLPGHLVMDADRKFLYGCDPVGKKIFRIDITSGSNSGSIAKVNNETLAGGYVKYSGIVIQNIVTTGLTAPVGIDVYGNRLVVTDNGSDEIILYDIQNNFSEIGRLKLNYVTNPDPMGIKVGPDGRLYFVDMLNQQVYRLDNTSVTAIQPTTESESIQFAYPNPVNDYLYVNQTIPIPFTEMVIVDKLGKTVIETRISDNTPINVSILSAGIYSIQLRIHDKLITHKFLKQ